ncbi:LacI family DNA-binding transcriptional regulator [Dactylosporangium sp. CA-139066]|uniref:LacI family DNA-binding transcriptional regulator n=1 Tax=Dactylosporangium sp. CA-139066 TaxID=3239930 RepID=UPI003D8FB954
MSRKSRRATMAEVAARAGVSPMTVSYTYNEPSRVADETRARVLLAAIELGYAGPDPAARSLRRGSTRTLGVVLGERLTYAFDDPQAVQFLAGIAEVSAEHGFGMTILPTSGSDADVQRVRDAAVDAFVLWTTSDDDPVLDAVAATRRPAAIQGGPARPGFTMIGADDRAAARAIGAHAFNAARRPAVVSFPLGRDRTAAVVHGPDPASASFPVTRHRLEGFRDAATDAGIAWQSVPVAVCATNDADLAQAAAAGLIRDGHDAIAAMSDQQALGVLRAAERAGIAVPDRLAVTGWDDSETARQRDLTSAAQSLREQGRACAAKVLTGSHPGGGSSAWSITVRGSTRR